MGLGKTLLLGAAAGLAGTATMTGVQLGVRRLRGQPLGTPVPKTWAEAPAPAQLVKKAATAFGEGNRVTKQDAPLVANLMHWAYGTFWGAAYALVARVAQPAPLAGGAVFGAGVWALSYAELVPLGIYKPPWRYPPSELAPDLAYHLAYGVAVGGAYAVLDR